VAIDLENLSEDAGALRELVTNAELENAGLRAEIDKLHMLIKGFQRHRFGERSELLDAEQMQLVIEDLEQTMGAGAAAGDARAETEAQAGQPSSARPARRQRNLGQLPD
jgi:transposase